MISFSFLNFYFLIRLEIFIPQPGIKLELLAAENWES